MADRPIIFSAPMVRALLDGRKTQTRRIAGFVQPDGDGFHIRGNGGGVLGADEDAVRTYGADYAPYAVGDRLYVREEWKSTPAYDDLKPSDMSGDQPLCYPADGATFNWAEADGGVLGRRRPGMHMPRWASRLTLCVDEVRVERLQAISETDAQAEGVERGLHPITGEVDGWKDYSIIHAGPHKGKQHPHAIAPWKSAALSFQSLWDTLHGIESWNEDPWVVAVTFRVERANIDQFGGAL